MERLGKLSKVTQAGIHSGFPTTEATLRMTLPWNIVRKTEVHDPDLNLWDRAFPQPCLGQLISGTLK